MGHEYVPRGLQFAVLRAIPLQGANACGTVIHAHIERNAGRDIPTAQVYLALQRLKARGLVEVIDTGNASKCSPAGRKGHPRRVYGLSASGLQAIDAGMKLLGIRTDNKGKDVDENSTGGLIPNPV